MNQVNEVSPLIQAAIIHAQFEMIHPFKDGNGRVGRLLIPLFYIHPKYTSPTFTSADISPLTITNIKNVF